MESAPKATGGCSQLYCSRYPRRSARPQRDRFGLRSTDGQSQLFANCQPHVLRTPTEGGFKKMLEHFDQRPAHHVQFVVYGVQPVCATCCIHTTMISAVNLPQDPDLLRARPPALPVPTTYRTVAPKLPRHVSLPTVPLTRCPLCTHCAKQTGSHTLTQFNTCTLTLHTLWLRCAAQNVQYCAARRAANN